MLLLLFLASASVNIGQLEHQLILSVDPWRIRQILIELHGMTSERQFWTVSNKVIYFMLSYDRLSLGLVRYHITVNSKHFAVDAQYFFSIFSLHSLGVIVMIYI